MIVWDMLSSSTLQLLELIYSLLALTTFAAQVLILSSSFLLLVLAMVPSGMLMDARP